MSVQCAATARPAAGASMSRFERYLSLWVLLRIQSGAALATVVGVLIEVPVMLLVVRIVNSSQGWYEQR